MAFEKKMEDGVEWVRIATLPDQFKTRINCSNEVKANLDKIKTMYVCCNSWSEYIEGEFFYKIAADLL